MTDTEISVWTKYPEAQQKAMDDRARAAAKREYENDPNRKDPKHTQDRVEKALYDLRVRMGIEK